MRIAEVNSSVVVPVPSATPSRPPVASAMSAIHSKTPAARGTQATALAASNTPTAVERYQFSRFPMSIQSRDAWA